MDERPHSWGAVRVLLAAALLTYVWRVQDLFPLIGPLKPVMLTTAALVLVILLDRRLPSAVAATASRWPLVIGAVLVGLAIVGVPFSLYPGLSVDLTVKVLLPAVLLMVGIAAAIEAPLDAYRMAAVCVGGAFIYSAVILTRFHVGPDGRLGDLIYYDSNDLGLLLVTTLPLADWLARHARRPLARAAALSSILVFVYTIVKTGSRGAFVGLLTVIAYSILANRSTQIRYRVRLAMLAAGLLVAAAGSKYRNQLDTLLHPTKDYNWIGNAQGGRMDIWMRGIGYMVARPITGVGAGAFPVAEGTLSPLAARQDYGVGLKWSAAHNSYVQIGAELGIPGIVAFGALLAIGWRRARRAARLGIALGDLRAAAMGDALATALVGYAVSGFFLSEAYCALLYTIIGIIVGLQRLLHRRLALSDDTPEDPEPAIERLQARFGPSARTSDA